ncbi:MAG: hypothetical protein KDD02_00030, partial [Phaeodactylibacter sp.]|nr:hypothetical protein [Phaeodactylibacter sp.]
IQEDIRPILNHAISNFNNRDFQSSLARSQDAFLQLTRLDRKVLQKQMEFDRLYNTTLDAATTFLEMVRENRKIKLEEGAYVAELDYWTRGQYSELEKTAQQLKAKLETEKESPGFTTEKVRKILEQLETQEEERRTLIRTTIERVYSSHKRAQLADLIERALGTQNFRVVNQGRGFEGNDQRGSYLIKLKAGDGAEIVAVITPNEKANTNSLSFNTYKDKSGEGARLGRWEELKKALGAYGIAFDNAGASVQEEGIRELYDVEGLIQEGKLIPEAVKHKARMM